jgi:threonine/homoserine/homoserine lactone efflux protein
MLEYSLLLLFLPTSFFISITPGLCMTLSMSLGMSIGLRRTLYMMLGELVGVGLVAVAAVLGVSAIMLNYPTAFSLFKWAGGAYLVFIGIQMWLSKGKLSLNLDNQQQESASNLALVTQGFVTAIANPKGWAFMMSLLPPFINSEQALAPQLTSLVIILLSVEFICLMLYASGGRVLKHLLASSGNVKMVNRVAGSLMFAVGIWLVAS